MIQFDERKQDRQRSALYKRRGLACILLFLLLSACVLLYVADLSAPGLVFCPIYAISGLSCPGCGMTRAVQAVLHGDLARAVQCNPFVFPALCLLAYVVVDQTTKAWCGHPVLRPLPQKRWIWLGIVAVLCLFGVLRNIPCEPFVGWLPPV